MKHNILTKIMSFVLLVLVVSSCSKKWIDSDINTNPDAPADVPIDRKSVV